MFLKRYLQPLPPSLNEARLFPLLTFKNAGAEFNFGSRHILYNTAVLNLFFYLFFFLCVQKKQIQQINLKKKNKHVFEKKKRKLTHT